MASCLPRFVWWGGWGRLEPVRLELLAMPSGRRACRQGAPPTRARAPPQGTALTELACEAAQDIADFRPHHKLQLWNIIEQKTRCVRVDVGRWRSGPALHGFGKGALQAGCECRHGSGPALSRPKARLPFTWFRKRLALGKKMFMCWHFSELLHARTLACSLARTHARSHARTHARSLARTHTPVVGTQGRAGRQRLEGIPGVDKGAVSDKTRLHRRRHLALAAAYDECVGADACVGRRCCLGRGCPAECRLSWRWPVQACLEMGPCPRSLRPSLAELVERWAARNLMVQFEIVLETAGAMQQELKV